MTRRPLAQIEADIADLDARLLPYGSFDQAEQEVPGLLERLAALYAERDHALNQLSHEPAPFVAHLEAVTG